MAGQVDDAATAAAVATAYGLGRPLAASDRPAMVLAARGEQGRVWRLDTETGPVAIKELVIRSSESATELDVGYQEAVIAAATVPMPRPLRTTTGSVLLEVDGHQLRAYAWVELAASDTGQDPALVGGLVAAIHRVPHEPVPPVHDWYDAPVGRDRWTELAAMASAAAAPFADGLAAEVEHLIALEAEIRPRRRIQACHRDLWADNVLPTAAGGICVIDWENCGLEDPARELPMVLLDFGQGDPTRMATLYAAYRDAGGPARLVDRSDFTMVIAQFGHFWEAAVVRWLDPAAQPEERAHQLGRIAELLVDPLRVSDLDDVLDALT